MTEWVSQARDWVEAFLSWDPLLVLRDPTVERFSQYVIIAGFWSVAFFATGLFLYELWLQPKDPPEKSWAWFMGSLSFLCIRYVLQSIFHDKYLVLGALCWLSLLGAVIQLSAYYLRHARELAR